MEPPIARKDRKEILIHGKTLIDDYHYMRNKDSEEVLNYLKAENAYSEEQLAHTKDLQDTLFQEMKSRINETDQSHPYRWGDYYYYTRTEEGKNYPIYCRRKTLDADEEVFLDVNELAEGKDFCRVGDIGFDSGHNILMYSVDFSGYETYDIVFKDLRTGQILEEKISGVGGDFVVVRDYLYYNELDEIHRTYTVRRHKLGDKDSNDDELFREDDNRFFIYQYPSRDKKFLLVFANGPDTTTAYYIDLENGGPITPFQGRKEGEEFIIDHHEGYFYFTTNRDAKNYKLCKTPVTDTSEENWSVLLDHDLNRKVETPSCFKDYMVVFVRKGGFRSILYLNYTDESFEEVNLPEKIYGIFPSEANKLYDTQTYRFHYSSLITPMSEMEVNFSTGAVKTLKTDVVNNFNRDDYASERLYAEAEDGTKIPISMAYKKDVKFDGTAPLLLYGYGSYGASIDPYFDAKRLSLLDRGIIYCIAHIRGGGELGRLWYENGKLAKKMNTFKDFIASAEYLIENKYTSKDRIAIWGGSAGGLLIGATINLRPDLFKAAIAQVPFVDVINTMMDDSIPLTTFEYKEWGNPNIETEFEWMYEYSPYDNVSDKEYPNLLITGGLNDPRVHVWEPAKWAAKLRDHWKGSNKLLVKINMGAGHSGASGRYDYMKETAFYYAFIIDNIMS